eukprot:g71071.t1
MPARAWRTLKRGGRASSSGRDETLWCHLSEPAEEQIVDKHRPQHDKSSRKENGTTAHSYCYLVHLYSILSCYVYTTKGTLPFVRSLLLNF